MMEIDFCINGNYANCDDYMGPVEIEALISILFFCAGIFGCDSI